MGGDTHTDFERSLASASETGFRLGEKGTHTSRTIMLEELTTLLHAVPDQANRGDYAQAILENNCLGSG